MSISTVSIIRERVLSATASSKIAVFRVTKIDKFTKKDVLVFDAVFDNTITTQKKINDGCEMYVGSYFGVDGALLMACDLV